MFEGRDSGIAWGAVVRNHGIAQANARAADKANDSAWAWRRHAETLEARIRELEQDLSIERASVAGLSAQLDALYKQHPDSPLLKASGNLYRDGKKKPRIRDIFEAAFDATARKLGIHDPSSRRLD